MNCKTTKTTFWSDLIIAFSLTRLRSSRLNFLAGSTKRNSLLDEQILISSIRREKKNLIYRCQSVSIPAIPGINSQTMTGWRRIKRRDSLKAKVVKSPKYPRRQKLEFPVTNWTISPHCPFLIFSRDWRGQSMRFLSLLDGGIFYPGSFSSPLGIHSLKLGVL